MARDSRFFLADCGLGEDTSCPSGDQTATPDLTVYGLFDDEPTGVSDVLENGGGSDPTTEMADKRRGRLFDWEDCTGEPEETLDVPRVDPTISPTAAFTLQDQMEDPSVRRLIEALQGHKRVPRAYRMRVQDKYELRPEGLHRHALLDGEPGLVLVVPRRRRASLLARYHFSLIDGGGHVGGQTMYDQLRVHYFWPDMERECHAYVAACETCGATRSQGAIPVDPAASPTPDAPFQVVHVDHKGPLPLSGGYTYVLVVVCALTRYTVYVPVTSTTGEETLSALNDRVFAYFGHPLIIISDNGSSFANKLMKASERLYGYRQIFVMPHTPQANGLAEAAVKRLKLILDRHTLDYAGWHRLLGMAQTTVNLRVNSGSVETPFASVFGRPATTLTALENPSLLPAHSPEEKSVQGLAEALSRMHRRLRHEIDAMKEAAVLSSPARPATGRRVRPGDKVWLVYSDSERARYLRKHGHGRPWRHAYVVEEVKPHAVRLHLPGDGSVPEVLPWQSLRKCSFAAPHFHDIEMPKPALTASGQPVVESAHDDGTPIGTSVERDETTAQETAQPPPAGDDNGWSAWTADPSQEYEIETIVSAKRVGSGWRLLVKWKGYPTPTEEPLSRIVSQTAHPDLLADIERCKQEYHASQVMANQAPRRVNAPVKQAPSRVQPLRERDAPKRFLFHLSSEPDDAASRAITRSGFARYREHLVAMKGAASMCLPDARLPSPCVFDDEEASRRAACFWLSPVAVIAHCDVGWRG